MEGQAASPVTGASGVRGIATASSGETYGVAGHANSPAGYGLYTPDDARVEGQLSTASALDVDGSLSVGSTTLSVRRSSNQTIPSGSRTQVEFDTVETDDFSGWNGSTFAYEVQEAGTYHVDYCVNWPPLPEGDNTTAWLTVDGADTMRATGSTPVTLHVSRTLPDLAAGESIAVDVSQDSGSDKDLEGGLAGTWLTVTKVG